MPKAKYYTPEWLKEELDKISSYDKIDYWQLMKAHRIAVMIAKTKLSGEDLLRLRGSIEKSLIVSITDLAKTEKIGLRYIQRNYPELDWACRGLYLRENEEAPWRQLVRKAHLIYPPKNPRGWNLKKIIERLDGEDERNILVEKILKEDSGFVAACIKRAGNFGKAAILSGMNYLAFTKSHHKKTDYTFSKEEILKLALEPSLDNNLRARVIFNIFSLQYRPPDTEFSVVLGEQHKGYRNCQRHIYFSQGLETRFDQGIEDMCKMRILLILDPSMKNRVMQSGLYFQQTEAIEATIKEYHAIKDLVTEVNRKLSRNTEEPDYIQRLSYPRIPSHERILR